MKKGDNKGSKKTEIKKKEKVVDDMTFGLKNKNKSQKVQKYVTSTILNFTFLDISNQSRIKSCKLSRG